jgi:energy-coupling factor transport system permease protein
VLWVIGIALSSLVLQDPLLLIVVFVSMIPFVIIGKITRSWWSFIRLALWLSLLIIVINILINPEGNTVLFKLSSIPLISTLQITMESLFFAATMSLRLLCMISAFALLSLLINPDILLQLALKLRFPLKSVLTTSIALRFIPVLFQDVQTLQDSIQTRGFSLQPKKMMDKIRYRSLLVMPLLSATLDRSIQTAEAMEARGFGSTQKISHYQAISLTWIDRGFILGVLGFIGFILWLGITSVVSFSFYPTVTMISFTPLYTSVLLSIILFILFPLLCSPVKKVVDIDPVY